MVFRLILLCLVVGASAEVNVRKLHSKYKEIFFRSKNRNSASHLWATYVIKNLAPTATEAEVYKWFSGFCPVSGSPVSGSYWRTWTDLKVKKATNVNEETTATVNVCCWPCICDIQQFVKVDTLKINTKDGLKEFPVLVIGDPCMNPSKIPKAASELYCVNNVLQGATKSANGHIVIGMVQPANKAGRNTAKEYVKNCEARKNRGYRWGMGKIFVRVASINPIN